MPTLCGLFNIGNYIILMVFLFLIIYNKKTKVMVIKKVSTICSIVLLATCVLTIGGVFATWSFAGQKVQSA